MVEKRLCNAQPKKQVNVIEQWMLVRTWLYVGQPMADEVIAWLREYAFKLHGEHNTVHDRDGRAIQADMLFTR